MNLFVIFLLHTFTIIEMIHFWDLDSEKSYKFFLNKSTKISDLREAKMSQKWPSI